MRHRRRLSGRILGALATLVFLGWLGSLGGVLVLARRDEAARATSADAIVVLGAAQYVGRPSPVLQARLDHAIALWKVGRAPRLILTGGTGVGDTTSEAAVGRKYALRRGVPDSAIVLENRGRTTSESMRAVARIMDAEPGRTVVLVSDPFHMFRLSILAERFGLEPFTSPTRTSPISSSVGEQWKYVLGESVKAPLAFLLERKQS